MLDTIAFVLFAAIFFVALAVLLGAPALSNATRAVAAFAALVWAGAVIAAAQAGYFAPGALGPLPGVGVAVGAALAIGLAAWLLSPRVRSALLAVQLPALVAMHAARIVPGVFFLLLLDEGRLSAPFATSAGYGDIAVGLAAPFVALAALRGARAQTLVGAWNALGALDLVTALTLGALSAPGTPFQVFTAAPGTAIIGDLPWAIVPALLVPLYLMSHLVIAAKVWAPSAPPKLAAI